MFPYKEQKQIIFEFIFAQPQKPQFFCEIVNIILNTIAVLRLQFKKTVKF